MLIAALAIFHGATSGISATPPHTGTKIHYPPNLYKESKAKVVQILTEAESIAITDTQISRGTQRYISITAHTINSDWETVNVVL